MLRRVNIYSICFVFGLSALFFTSSVFTDDSNYRPSTKDSRNAWNYLKTGNGEDGLLQPISMDPDDGSPNIEAILDKTRSEIKLEMQKENLTNFGVDKLEDLILETNGNPVRSIIVSTWRSGSSFLGEILDAMPGNFYRFEPLQHYGNVQIMRGALHADDAIKTIKKMLKCDYSGLDDYFKFIKTRMFKRSISKKTWDHCNDRKELCYDTNFTSRFCKLFPFQSMKVLRMSLSLFEDVLEDQELNIKMIFLVRDPRGVMQSRQHLDFSQQDTHFWKPEHLCAHMVSNHVAAGRLIQKYPDRFMILRYEELALAPYETTHQLLKFLRLGAPKSVDEFLHTHTNVEVAGVISTFRVSQNVPFKWKNLLKYSHVKEIQEVCKEAMSLWGYKLANNATHMTSKEYNPLEPYTITQ